ncbi:MAG: hypothetical protein ACLFTI_02890 [Anaerolineales bacterium]
MVKQNTYTYTARSVENPEYSVTFTLFDHRMSVGTGAPMEQMAGVFEREGAEEEVEEEKEEGVGDSIAAEVKKQSKLWLKPMAISLVERGTQPFHVDDVNADVEGDWLRVQGWVRTGGLRLAPVTLMKGRVDNPDAASAFVNELNERKTETFGPLALFDYWGTWFFAGFAVVLLLQIQRHRGRKE